MVVEYGRFDFLRRCHFPQKKIKEEDLNQWIREKANTSKIVKETCILHQGPQATSNKQPTIMNKQINEVYLGILVKFFHPNSNITKITPAKRKLLQLSSGRQPLRNQRTEFLPATSASWSFANLHCHPHSVWTFQISPMQFLARNFALQCHLKASSPKRTRITTHSLRVSFSCKARG